MRFEPLLIIGAGGFARETAAAVKAINESAPRWRLLGFLDDNPALYGATVDGHEVIGPVAAFSDHANARVAVCIGSPRNYACRRQVVERIGNHSEHFATIIHPSVSVGDGCTIGAGTVVLAQAVTTTGVSIGEHVAVMPHCVFTHDDRIESFATFGAGVRLAGGVTIEEGAYVGSGSVVREGATVGEWSLIGMGSVVLGDVPAGEVWVGAPARRLRPAAPEGAVSVAPGASCRTTH